MAESLRKEQEQAKAESEAEAGIQSAELAEEARKAREALEAERRRAEVRRCTQYPPPPPAVVAALPERAKGDAAAPGDKAALALDVQKELKRVGCYSGEVDGKWGDGTRTALNDFATRAKVSLSADEPTQSALDTLTASKEGVCPQSSGKRKSASDDDQSSSKARQQKRASSSGSKKGRDCSPIVGPYGRYDNPWCK